MVAKSSEGPDDGIRAPPVAAKLADRVAHLVFVSCIIPPEGATLLESLPPLVGIVSRWLHRGGIVRRTGYLQARYLFCTGFSAADRRFVVRNCVADSARVFTEPVSRLGMPQVPRTTSGSPVTGPSRRRRSCARSATSAAPDWSCWTRPTT